MNRSRFKYVPVMIAYLESRAPTPRYTPPSE